MLGPRDVYALAKFEERRVLWIRDVYLRWTPHPVIVNIRDKKDYVRVVLCSYYTIIPGRGPSSCTCLLKGLNTCQCDI